MLGKLADGAAATVALADVRDGLLGGRAGVGRHGAQAGPLQAFFVRHLVA